MSSITPYAAREICFHGSHVTPAGWRVKLYSIVYGDRLVEWPLLSAGVELALAELPAPPVTGERPGVAFLIAHLGCGAEYLVLGWWDRQNELPVRVLVREDTEGEGDGHWRPARGGESFCVWDLQVFWGERNAYVATVMAGDREPGQTDANRTDAYMQLAIPEASRGEPSPLRPLLVPAGQARLSG